MENKTVSLLIYIPDSLKKKLKTKAAMTGKKMYELIQEALTQCLADKE